MTEIKTVHFDINAYDNLPLAFGRKVRDVQNIHSVLVDQLKVPGTSHVQGRQELLQNYKNFLDSIGQQGWDERVDHWFKLKEEEAKQQTGDAA